jgi:hypothetical protein
MLLAIHYITVTGYLSLSFPLGTRALAVRSGIFLLAKTATTRALGPISMFGTSGLVHVACKASMGSSTSMYGRTECCYLPKIMSIPDRLASACCNLPYECMRQRSGKVRV